MQTFLATALLFALVMAAMALGVLITGRRLRGSCGLSREDCSCSLAERRACRLKGQPAPDG